MPDPIQATLRSIVTISPGVWTLRIVVPFKFESGQAVQVHFPGDEKKRYYSISSSPTDGPFVEITVKTDEKSALAEILKKLNAGMAIPTAGPMGSFRLPADLERPLCFIAAGSGITPFRSMIKYMIDTHHLPESWVFHSARTPSGLIFEREFNQWETAHRALHYMPTLTQDRIPDWKFETGRITEALVRKHIQAEAHRYLLSGSPIFVGDMEKMLLSMGIAAEQIRREQW